MHRTTLTLTIAGLFLVGCGDAHDPLSVADAAVSFAGAPAPTASDIFELEAPIFGLATTPDGSLLAAQPLVGITELRQGAVRATSPLRDVSGVVAVGRGQVFAITGEPFDPTSAGTSRRLFRVSPGETREIADLGAFEASANPDHVWNPGPPDSNPFAVAHLKGGQVLVADAAGNSILVVEANGAVDWVAVLTPRLVPTAHFKALVGCTPDAVHPPCNLPAEIPAEPVPTSIAVGPDGAYYTGELTGFPGAPGVSRVWRIEPESRHVLCPSDACTLVADGFTSIMDLAFGPDGTLHVVEFDAMTWLGVSVFAGGGLLAPVAGGRVSSCDVQTGQCVVRADGLELPAGIAVGRDGVVWVAENATIPGPTARVRAIP